jgi:hypothetical protein
MTLFSDIYEILNNSIFAAPPTFPEEFSKKLKDYLKKENSGLTLKINNALKANLSSSNKKLTEEEIQQRKEEALGNLTRLFNTMIQEENFSKAMLMAEYNRIDGMDVDKVQAYSKKMVKEAAQLIFDFKENGLIILKPEISEIFPRLQEIIPLCNKAGTPFEDMLLKSIAALHSMCCLGEMPKSQKTNFNKVESLNDKGREMERVQNTISKDNLFDEEIINPEIDVDELKNELDNLYVEIEFSINILYEFSNNKFHVEEKKIRELISNSKLCEEYINSLSNPILKNDFESLIKTCKSLNIAIDRLQTKYEFLKQESGPTNLQNAQMELQNSKKELLNIDTSLQEIIKLNRIKNIIKEKLESVYNNIQSYLTDKADSPNPETCDEKPSLQQAILIITEFQEKLNHSNCFIGDATKVSQDLTQLSEAIDDTLRTPVFRLVEVHQNSRRDKDFIIIEKLLLEEIVSTSAQKNTLDEMASIIVTPEISSPQSFANGIGSVSPRETMTEANKIESSSTQQNKLENSLIRLNIAISDTIIGLQNYEEILLFLSSDDARNASIIINNVLDLINIQQKNLKTIISNTPPNTINNRIEQSIIILQNLEDSISVLNKDLEFSDPKPPKSLFEKLLNIIHQITQSIYAFFNPDSKTIKNLNEDTTELINKMQTMKNILQGMKSSNNISEEHDPQSSTPEINRSSL